MRAIDRFHDHCFGHCVNAAHGEHDHDFYNLEGGVKFTLGLQTKRRSTTDLVDELCDADDVVVGAVEDGDAEHAARLEAVRLRERPLHPQPLRHAAHVQDLQPGRKIFV